MYSNPQNDCKIECEKLSDVEIFMQPVAEKNQ